MSKWLSKQMALLRKWLDRVDNRGICSKCTTLNRNCRKNKRCICVQIYCTCFKKHRYYRGLGASKWGIYNYTDVKRIFSTYNAFALIRAGTIFFGAITIMARTTTLYPWVRFDRLLQLQCMVLNKRFGFIKTITMKDIFFTSMMTERLALLVVI